MQQIIDCLICWCLVYLFWVNDGCVGVCYWLEMQCDLLVWLQKMYVVQLDFVVVCMGLQCFWCLFYLQVVQELMVDCCDDL